MALGGIWAHLGVFCGALGAICDNFGGHGEHLGSSLWPWGVLVDFWVHFGGPGVSFGLHLGSILGAFWPTFSTSFRRRFSDTLLGTL